MSMNMNTRPVKPASPARRVAYAGLVAALSCMLLYLLYLLPTMRLSILFVLSLLPVVLAHEKRYADAALCFAASALISGLLFPAKGAWLLYAAFFGWYGIAREAVVARLGSFKKWLALALIFNIAFFALYFLARSLFPELNGPIWKWLIIPVAEVAFLLYENLFGVCRDLYSGRLRKLIFR